MSHIDKDLIESQLPLSIDEIVDRGKRIIFVTNNKHMQDSAFVFFYAMQGYIRFKECKHDQMVIILSRKKKNGSLEECKRLYYGDVRFLGFIKYCTTPEQIIDIFKSIGPDYSKGEVTLNMFKEKLSNKRIKTKKIADFLLDNKQGSSLGNWMRAEILYIACISPYRELKDLSKKDIKRLYKAIIRICEESYAKGGLTLHSFRDPYGNDGNYKALVYGRKKDDNGEKITHEKFGSEPKGKTDNRRSIWYCPAVQI